MHENKQKVNITSLGKPDEGDTGTSEESVYTVDGIDESSSAVEFGFISCGITGFLSFECSSGTKSNKKS